MLIHCSLSPGSDHEGQSHGTSTKNIITLYVLILNICLKHCHSKLCQNVQEAMTFFCFICPTHCNFSCLFSQENPFLLFLKKEVQKVFQECKMIAVVQNNVSNADDMIMFKHRLHKHGIAVRLFPNKVIANVVPFYAVGLGWK